MSHADEPGRENAAGGLRGDSTGGLRGYSSGGLRVNPEVDMVFDRPDRGYAPGGELTVRYQVRGSGLDLVRAIEQSIAWYTEGKGEEDLAVHFFERLAEPAARAAVTQGGRFSTALPPSPLSYEGVIVRIRWCARVRLFFPSGRDYVSEHEFVVGRIPPARMPTRGER
jgi:hypothetical protein